MKIAVQGNPLKDITVLEDVKFVMHGGKIVKKYLDTNKIKLGCDEEYQHLGRFSVIYNHFTFLISFNENQVALI